MEIRIATPEDAESITAIYAHYVRDTVISFEQEPPTLEEMRERVLNTLRLCPWLVCVEGSEVLGYAYANRHRERHAYQWSVDVSVYIHSEHHRKGIGKTLYATLFSLLRLQGYYNAFAGITLPNSGSVGIHESFGFQLVGIYRSVGFKFDRWHDTGWWQMPLQPLHPSPLSPIPFSEFRLMPECQSVLDRHS